MNTTMENIPNQPTCPNCPDPTNRINLTNDMRNVWMEHVYWTRMLIISIAEKLRDEKDVTTRLLQNPDDIADIYSEYYPASTAKTISDLLTEHLKIGAALITALRDNDSAKAEELDRQWHVNADQIADAFSSINPYYNREILHNMLNTHLDLTTQEAVMRIMENYPADIATFGKVEQEALEMADYFTGGITRQFPQLFR